MNISKINSVNTQKVNNKKANEVNKKNNAKSIALKTAVIAGSLTAATIAGILITKKVNPKNIFKSEKSEKAVKTVLNNGISKTEKIRQTSGGKIVKTNFSKPINGVKSMQSCYFSNGDLSNYTTFDNDGKALKRVSFLRTYLQNAKGNLNQVVVEDSKQGISSIAYNYSPKTGDLVGLDILKQGSPEKKINLVDSISIKEFLHSDIKNVPENFKKVIDSFKK